METLHEVLRHLKPKQQVFCTKTFIPSPMSVGEYNNLLNYKNNLQILSDCNWDKSLEAKFQEEINRLENYLKQWN